MTNPLFTPRPKFLETLEAAKYGDTVVYHVGSLMRDRMLGMHFLEVNATACAAWEIMEAGVVMLLQRKVAPGVFEYRARKLASPYKPVEWFGSYAAHKKRFSKPEDKVRGRSRERQLLGCEV